MFRVLAYLIGGFMLVAATLVLIVEPSQGALVVLMASVVLGVLGSGLAAVGRRGALRRQTAREEGSAFEPAPQDTARRALARHAALGPGLLELDHDSLRFTGAETSDLRSLIYLGLDLDDAPLLRTAARPFWRWLARGRLRALADLPRVLRIPRRDIFACAGFDSVSTGPELVLGYYGADRGAGRWVALFLAQETAGRFPIPSDDPQPWVRALQPEATAEQACMAAARARRRIHRRLVFAATVFGAAAASLPLLFFVALLGVLAVTQADRAAALATGVLVVVWMVTSMLIGLINWWSYR